MALMNTVRFQRISLISVAYWFGNFALPIVFLVLLLLWNHIYPFGAESFLTEDLKFQYIDFYAWYKGVLEGTNNVGYSLAQGLGSNTWGLFSYYLSSPFNLLLLFFSYDRLTDFCLVITLLKLGCIQVATVWFLSHRFTLPRFFATLLGLGFTCSSWVITMLRNPNWLDALILLPLAMYAVYQFIRSSRWKLLVLWLVMLIVTCWYMGYMCMLFLGLYAIFELLVARVSGVAFSRMHIVKLVLGYVGVYGVALLLSTWTFLPTVFAMSSITASPAENSAFWYTSLAETGAGIYLGNMLPTKNIPQLYMGSFGILLAALFFFGPTAPRKTKIALGLFLVLLLASCCVTPLYTAWCGFRAPNGFYCRNSFFATIMMVWGGAYAIQQLVSDKQSPWRKPIAFSFAGCALFASFLMLQGSFVRMRYGLLSIALYAIYSLLLLAYLPQRQSFGLKWAKGVTLIAFMSLMFTELLYSAHVEWQSLYMHYSQDEHDNYMLTSRTQLADLRSLDDGIYRFEKTYSRAAGGLNEGLSVGFCQLSAYSSANDASALAFLEALGYSQSGAVSVIYNTPILASDSLLGVKYLSSAGQPQLYEPTGSGSFNAVYAIAETYRNPYALPLGYGVDAAMANASFASNNPFENQNQFLNDVGGTNENYFAQLPSSVIADSPIEMCWRVEIPLGYLGYTYVMPAGQEPNCFITYETTAGELHSYVTWHWRHAIEPLGMTLSNEPHTINVAISADPVPQPGSPVQQELSAETYCVFYGLDISAFSKLIMQLSEHPFVPTVFSDGHIEGTYTSTGSDALLLTIPHSKGWSATVNGSSVATLGAYNNALMLIPVEKGENYVSLRFEPPGLHAGCITSIATIIGGCVILIIRHRMRKHHKPLANIVQQNK